METIKGIIKPYVLNCFILILPILVWNILLTDKLPANYQPIVFSRGIPISLTYIENISRILLFVIAFLMPLSFHTMKQRVGLYVYLFGVLLYFASWIVLIFFPASGWSNSAIGYSAPAYTPAVWITGIALIGDLFSFSLPFRGWIFICVSIVFLVAHISHTVLVYYQIK
ncbi:hypothetical protein ACR78F_10490 [Sphingobacterium spiritivorum]|uniref:hypothetical protein n=1 Tax=Sphingobacterium spiritivorum TaxID=258 RepID=UPI003DA66A86